MRRTSILTVIGATTLSIGLGVGTTLASANPARSSPTVTTTMMANGQPPTDTSMPIAEHAAYHQGAKQ